MNKKIISYILLVFVVLFGFNSRVDADVTLTCVYEGHFGPSDAIMFTQRNSIIHIYKHSDEDKPNANTVGWKESKDYVIKSDSKYFGLNNSIQFSDCPQYSDYINNTFYFYDDENSQYYDLGVLLPHHALLPDGRILEEETPPTIEETEVDDNDIEYDSEDVDTISGSCKATNDSFRNNDKWAVKLDKSKYDVTCLYSAYHNGGCQLLQIYFNTKELQYYSTLEKKVITDSWGVEATFEIKWNIYAQDIIDAYGNDMCPINIFYDDYYGLGSATAPTQTTFSLTGDSEHRYSLVKSTSDASNIEIPYVVKEINSCEDLLSEEVVGYLRFAFNAVRIAVPLILIVLGIVDFARGVFSSEDEMKKIQQKFIKRIILAVAFFLIPTVLGILFEIANKAFGINTDFCGLLSK